MKIQALSVHPPLHDFSRLMPLRSALWHDDAKGLRGTEILFLLGCGIAAALCVLLPEFKLQLPGHSILRAVFAMAFGLSLVPRLGAGTVMGLGAIGTAVVCGQLGVGKEGLGSFTSLCLTGPCLDMAVRYARSGPWLYVALTVGGLVSNLSAFAVQFSDRILHWSGRAGGGGRGLSAWLASALWTYPVFGIAAGLISALVWFRFSSRNSQSAGGQAS